MSIYKDLKPISFEKINTYELALRPSKVTVKDFSKPISKDDSLKDFLAKFPNILAVQSIRKLANRIRRAKKLGMPIIRGCARELGPGPRASWARTTRSSEPASRVYRATSVRNARC